jgi:hypothetical protein
MCCSVIGAAAQTHNEAATDKEISGLWLHWPARGRQAPFYDEGNTYRYDSEHTQRG